MVESLEETSALNNEYLGTRIEPVANSESALSRIML